MIKTDRKNTDRQWGVDEREKRESLFPCKREREREKSKK